MTTKLNKRMWLLLASGLFLLALVAIAAGYIDQINQQSRLSSEILSIKSQTRALDANKFTAQHSSLNITLLKYEAEIAEINRKLEYSLTISDIFQKLQEIAGNSSVIIKYAKSSSPATETLGGIKYENVSIDISVTGNVSNAYSFIGAITDAFGTGVLDNINVRIVRDDAQNNADASMRLTLYSYRGE